MHVLFRREQRWFHNLSCRLGHVVNERDVLEARTGRSLGSRFYK